MGQVNRRVTYRMYPSPNEEVRLERTRLLHQQLYNLALEQRITVYNSRKITLSFEDQCKELTALRAENPLFASLDAQSSQQTLKRLALAFDKFFARIKEGQSGGFPRFKKQDRYKGFTFSKTGWKFKPGTKQSKRGTSKHGKLTLSGIGTINVRGVPRNLGTMKNVVVTKKNGKWFASFVCACAPEREAGTERVGLDWGVENFATIAFESGETLTVPNPRITKKALEQQKQLDKELSRKQLGSANRAKAKEARARFFEKQKNQRSNFLHQISASLIPLLSMFATEELDISAMTSGGGKHKKGLNREILSTGGAEFLAILQYKAEEAGVVWCWIPTKQVKPSQTCHQCDRQEKKELSERGHVCECGANCTRDKNAARVILKWALAFLAKQKSGKGLESSPAVFQGDGAGIRETPAIGS